MLIAKHRFERREIGVGPEYEDAVELGVLFGLGLIDGEMVVAWRRQEAAIALVTDEALVALLQPPLERGQDGGSGGGVLLHLVAIATDDIAPPGENDGFGLVLDLFVPLRQSERDEGSGIVEHEFARQRVRAFANAQDVEEPARLQFGDRLSADHAPIGDDANPADGKALAQPIDHRDQAARIGGIPRPCPG